MANKSNWGGVRPPRGPNRFNEREVARAVRGVEATGREAERVQVDPKNGTITVFVRGGKPENKAGAI